MPATPVRDLDAARIANAARTLRDHYEGSYDVFFERLAEDRPLRLRHARGPLEIYGYAAAYSPDPERPGKALLPFEVASRPPGRGRLAALARPRPGPDGPGHADALRSMRRIYLDAGRGDECTSTSAPRRSAGS